MQGGDMMCEIWVMRASPAVAQGIAGGEKWWGLRRVCNKCKCPWRWGGTSCCGESCQLTMGRGICGLGKDPKHVREMVGGMWGRGLKLCQSLSRNGHSHRNGYWHIVLQGTRGHKLVKDKECDSLVLVWTLNCKIPRDEQLTEIVHQGFFAISFKAKHMTRPYPLYCRQFFAASLLPESRCLWDFHFFRHTFQTSTWCIDMKNSC